MSVPAKEHIGRRGWMKKRLPKKKNLFITDPNASYAGKDSWRALKITNIRRKVVFTHCGLKVHSYYLN